MGRRRALPLSCTLIYAPEGDIVTLLRILQERRHVTVELLRR
jgi:hypothetical protein